MTRSARPYASGAEGARVFAGFSTDVPVAGFYRMRLRSGAALCGVRIWFGPPHDPVTGEEMDRGWRWQAELNGAFIELDQVWPRCARESIAEADYRTLCAKRDWAERHAPGSPLANPRRVADPLETPLLF